MKSFLKKAPTNKKKFKFIYLPILFLILIFAFILNFYSIKSHYYLNVSGLYALKGNSKLSLEYLNLSLNSKFYPKGAYYHKYVLTDDFDSLKKAYENSQYNFFYLSKLAEDSIKKGKWKESQNYFSGIKLARYLSREGVGYVYNSDKDISRMGLFYLSSARKISSDPRISYEFGRALCWKYNSFDKGTLLIKEALKKDPVNSSYYRELGSIEKRKGNYPKALSCFIISKRIDPNNYWNYINIAEILRDESYLDESLKYLEKAKEVDRKIESAYYLSAGIYRKLDRLNLAYTEYQKIIEINPLSYSPRYNFGVFLYSVGEYEKAITQFTMAIIFKDDHMWSYYYRSLAFEKLSKFDEALSDMKKAIYFDPKNESFFVRLNILESKVNETSNNKTKSH